MGNAVDMTREELIKLYTSKKGTPHTACDQLTGQEFEVPDSVWCKSMKALINGKLPDDQRLAIILHEKLCRSNHDDDGCGFFYEVKNEVHHDWLGDSHKYWWGKAQNVLKVVNGRADIDTVVDIIEAM